MMQDFRTDTIKPGLSFLAEMNHVYAKAASTVVSAWFDTARIYCDSVLAAYPFHDHDPVDAYQRMVGHFAAIFVPNTSSETSLLAEPTSARPVAKRAAG